MAGQNAQPTRHRLKAYATCAMFDPALPAANSPLASAEMRGQFNALQARKARPSPMRCSASRTVTMAAAGTG